MSVANSQKTDFSSAAMTALWRSAEPKISGDELSAQLTTPFEQQKAKEFIEQFHYPLIERKIGVRAAFFLDEAVSLLNTGSYDACISFASGFSLLTYYIALKADAEKTGIQFYDSDLKEMIEEREKRCARLNAQANSGLKKIKLKTFDLEAACRGQVRLQDSFQGCKNPVFILEGVIYFLSPACVRWLFSEIKRYEQAALILDYWPEEGVLQSKCFANAVFKLKGLFRENVVSYFEPGFWSEQGFNELTAKLAPRKNLSLQMVESQWLRPQERTLIDPDEFFPVKLYSATAACNS